MINKTAERLEKVKFNIETQKESYESAANALLKAGHFNKYDHYMGIADILSEMLKDIEWALDIPEEES